MTESTKALAIAAGLAGVAGAATLAVAPNQVSAATGTVTYADGATTVWQTPAFKSVKRYVVKDQTIAILGQKTVNGTTWYKIGAGEWIPEIYLQVDGQAAEVKDSTANVTAPKATTTSADTFAVQATYTEGAVTIWNGTSYTSASGKYLTTDSTVTAVATVQANGETWYKLSDGGYVPARFAAKAGSVQATQAATTATKAAATATAKTATPAATTQAATTADTTNANTGKTAADTATTATNAAATASTSTTAAPAAKATTPAPTVKATTPAPAAKTTTATTTAPAAKATTPAASVTPKAASTTPVATTATAQKATPATTTATAQKTTSAATQSTATPKTATATATPAQTLTVTYTNSVVTEWKSAGYTQTAGKYLTSGTTVTAVGKTTANGETWYQLSDGNFVSARFFGAEGKANSAAAKTAATTTATPAKTTTTATPAQSTSSSASTGTQASAQTTSATQTSAQQTPAKTQTTTATQTSAQQTPAKTQTTSTTQTAQTTQAQTTTATNSTATQTTATSANSSRAAQIAAVISVAKAQLGKPYVWGGKGPNSFDCSGLTHYAYLVGANKEIGGYTVAQESAGTVVSIANLQAGDLVFWGSHGATYHVAIYLGGGQYIAAPEPGENVKIASISSYFMPSFGVRVL